MKSLPYNVVLGEVDSTNTYARMMGEDGAPHGAWISARTQTSGRGRLGREWKSYSGNLFLSVVLRPNSDFPVSWTPLAVALAVYESAIELRPEAALALKWPNDLVLRDRKLGFRKVGGILCEGTGSSNGSFIVAGVGLNCAIAPEIDQPTASLGVNVDTFRTLVLPKITSVFNRPINEIRSSYRQASLLKQGDPISWKDLRLDDSNPEFKGVFESYGEHGELLACLDGTSEVQRLYSEEIKLRSVR